MKVIFLKDVPKTGKKYEVKEMAAGYVQNVLIPKGAVEVATPQALERMKKAQAGDMAHKMVQESLLAKNISLIEGKKITIKSKANDKGHLFAGLHQVDLVKVLHNELHIELLPEHIILKSPIKEIGTHTVDVSIGGKKTSFLVEVTN